MNRLNQPMTEKAGKQIESSNRIIENTCHGSILRDKKSFAAHILSFTTGKLLYWLPKEQPIKLSNPIASSFMNHCKNIYLCITYSIIKGQFLSYDTYVIWEVKDPLSR